MRSRQGKLTGFGLTCLVLLAAAPFVLARDSASAAREARELRETGRPGDAEDLLRRRLAEVPDDAQLLVELGEALLDTGRREDAFDVFRKVAASYPGRPPQARSAAETAALAAALARLGRDDPQRFRDAVRLYDDAIAADPEDFDVQVALGDLFLDKYNAEDARKTYEKVLTKDPENSGALLGLARVKRFDGATDAFELTEKALEQDGDLVPARLLLARQYLDLEDFASADREAERALEVNPRSAEAHALLAASALLAGDAREYERRLARGEEAAPRDPELFVTLADVAARRFLYARAVDFADRAVALDPKSWRGFALRGVNRLRTGDVAGGRRYLETAFAGDPFDVWTKNSLDLLDQMADYEVVETERFQLVMPAAEAGLLSLYLGPLAEEAYDALAARYGVALETPVRLEVFPRHADFSVRTIGLVGLGALGVSFGPVIAMDAPSARPPGEFHWGTTLWHELAHSFHMRLSGHRVPRWFTEGLAVFEERRARPGWGDRVDPDYLIAYETGRLAPVEDLNQGFMRPAYPRQIVFSYLQSSLVFDYVVDRWGFDAVVAMLEGYRDGRNTPEVVKDALGVDLEGLAAAFDRYFRDRFAGPLAAVEAPDDPHSPGDVRKRADQDPGDILAQLAAGRSLLEEDPETAVPYLVRARNLYPDYAGRDSPRWWLAQAHERAERLAEAEAELAVLTDHNQAHYPALEALARVRTALADAHGAAWALESAQYVHPYERQHHEELAAFYLEEGRAAAAVRERRAVLALDPFNRSEALYRLALAHRAAGDRKAARSAVLEALERAPNYEEALTLLLELRSAEDDSP
jgi:tetratricopeptide (TPR) repeat protein